MKSYLLKYEPVTGGYATNGHAYWLTILQVKWFGLVKKVVKQTMLIPYSSNLKSTLEKYDQLIKDKTPLK